LRRPPVAAEPVARIHDAGAAEPRADGHQQNAAENRRRGDRADQPQDAADDEDEAGDAEVAQNLAETEPRQTVPVAQGRRRLRRDQAVALPQRDVAPPTFPEPLLAPRLTC